MIEVDYSAAAKEYERAIKSFARPDFAAIEEHERGRDCAAESKPMLCECERKCILTGLSESRTRFSSLEAFPRPSGAAWIDRYLEASALKDRLGCSECTHFGGLQGFSFRLIHHTADDTRVLRLRYRIDDAEIYLKEDPNGLSLLRDEEIINGVVTTGRHEIRVDMVRRPVGPGGVDGAL